MNNHLLTKASSNPDITSTLQSSPNHIDYTTMRTRINATVAHVFAVMVVVDVAQVDRAAVGGYSKPSTDSILVVCERCVCSTGCTIVHRLAIPDTTMFDNAKRCQRKCAVNCKMY